MQIFKPPTFCNCGLLGFLERIVAVALVQLESPSVASLPLWPGMSTKWPLGGFRLRVLGKGGLGFRGLAFRASFGLWEIIKVSYAGKSMHTFVHTQLHTNIIHTYIYIYTHTYTHMRVCT